MPHGMVRRFIFLWFYRLYRQFVYAIYGNTKGLCRKSQAILCYMLPVFLSAMGPIAIDIVFLFSMGRMANNTVFYLRWPLTAANKFFISDGP